MAIFGASLIPSGVVSALMPGERIGELPQMPAYKPPSTARSIVGGIGDALQQWAGGQPTFGPEVARQRQYAQQLQAAQMQRAQQFADQKALIDYRAQNPPPTSFERDLQAAGIDPASPQGRQLYQQRITNLADPIQGIPTVDPSTGRPGLQFIRPSQLAGAPQNRPAIGTVVDQLPGMGVSDDQGGAMLSGAAQTGVISPSQAAQIRDSLGPNGQAAFQQWMTQNNIRIAQ